MEIAKSIVLDAVHAAFWFALLAATLLFAGGDLSYIYMQF
jgi:hypothetical protein